MSKETYLVAYEGGDGQSVLDYAIDRAKRDGARLLIVHILEWSPYAFLTPEELAERHKRRREELSRAESAVIGPALEKARAAGVEAASELRYGAVIDLILEIARDAGASMIVVGRTGGSTLGARIFGSVPIGLAQAAPVPTVIVP
jgi:nucleotide-binding universal stress UspA family protein